jgi:hypothetical protein
VKAARCSKCMRCLNIEADPRCGVMRAGATAAPFLLADYDPATFQKGGGAFQISGLRAAGARGRLQTSFNLRLNGTVGDLTRAPLMVIYASGPVSETGQLQPHRGRVGDPNPVGHSCNRMPVVKINKDFWGRHNRAREPSWGPDHSKPADTTSDEGEWSEWG